MATAPHSVDAATLLSEPAHAIQRVNRLIRGLHLWHLLSLDAPSVALLWTWFLARGNHIRLPGAAVLAMGLAVWMLYAADRLLDARLAPKDSAHLELRHHFHRQNQRSFFVAIAAASLAFALLLPGLAAQSIRLYLVLGALLFAYFVLIHAGPFFKHEKMRRLPKELAVGVFFSAATFIPTVAREPALRLSLLPAALLFATVCSLNCLFIYAWEHPQSTVRAHPTTRMALRYLPQIAFSATGFGLLLALVDGRVGDRIPWQIPVANATAAALLMLVHRNRDRLGPTTLRAAADLCLLSPLLLVPLLR